jgi:hypothetical protein
MSTITPPESLSASEMARQTSVTRDRYVDFLRLFSIAVVVLGHWLMAVVVWKGADFRTGNAIAMTPGLWIATWVLQVMPVFFFVGGFANLATIDGLRRKGAGASEFVAGRVTRLLKPVAVLLAVWLPVAVALQRVGVDGKVLGTATKLVCQPLWFIGVYLAVTALAPRMRALHAVHRYTTVLALAATAATVDVVRFGIGIDGLGYVNLLVVWLFAQQLGFFYGDGSLLKLAPRHLVAIAAGAVGTLALLTTVGPYPSSMVGLPGDRISNMSPPTTCIVALTVLQVALVMLARPYVQRWLQRERVWTAVIAGNGMIMTVFLWHLTAALLAIAALHALGAPQPTGGSLVWWATRPLWIAIAAVPLVALVAVFARFERPRPAAYTATKRYAPAASGVGIVLLSFAVFGIACSNVVDLVAGKPVNVAVVTVAPLFLLGCSVAGLACVRHAAPATRAA